jgi:short-subunit dehydrogenase
MREARSGRIISVTSMGGLIGTPFSDAYCAAKFAVEGLMESLAPVAAKFGVHVSLIEPGPVATSFGDNVGPSLQKRLANPADPYRPLLDQYLLVTKDAFAQAVQSADEVAAIILEAATTVAPHLRYQTSEATREFYAQKGQDITGDRVRAMTSMWLG